MKITLVYPGYKADPAGLQEPLGLLYIAAVLKKNGHNVDLIDLTFKEDFNVLKEPSLNSDVIGLTSTSSLFFRTKKVLQYIKKMNPEVICIIGGPHVIASVEDTLNNGFDYAVIGEGEMTIFELVNKIKNKKDPRTIDGIAYKKNGKIVVNKPREFIKNLDTLPFPARELWDYKKYFKAGVNEFGIMATRGCPFNCLFCKPLINKLFGNKVRKRYVKNVVDEIEQIYLNYKHLIKDNVFFWFRDDTLTFCGTKWFKEFRTELKKRNLKIKWGCHTRVDQVNYELLKTMKESGLFHVSFGVESGSQKILNFYRKGITVEQTIKAFDACHELGLETFAYIMVGAPIETRKDLQLTYKLIKRIKPGGIDVYTTMPLPGNDLYNYVIEHDLLKENINDIDYWSKTFPIKTKYINEKDLRNFRRKVYFYNGIHLFVKHITSVKNLRKLLKLIIKRPGFIINYLKRSF